MLLFNAGEFQEEAAVLRHPPETPVLDEDIPEPDSREPAQYTTGTEHCS